MTAQQSEVVAVQREVAAVDTHLVEVDDGLTNLTGRYNATVGLVEIMESSITTTITRVNQTDVRVSLVEEGVSSVNGTAKNNTAGLIELGSSLTGPTSSWPPQQAWPMRPPLGWTWSTAP